MSERPWLIDKSALVRLGRSPDSQLWATRIERGLVRISTITVLETGYSARTAQDLTQLLDLAPISSMPVEYLTPFAENRSVEVLRTLAELGHHRAPSIPDLLIASIAEQSKLVVLHVDKDFELISEVTGQPVERLRVDG